MGNMGTGSFALRNRVVYSAKTEEHSALYVSSSSCAVFAREQKAIAEKLKVQIKEARGNKDA